MFSCHSPLPCIDIDTSLTGSVKTNCICADRHHLGQEVKRPQCYYYYFFLYIEIVLFIFFPKCFMSIMWTCLSHTSAILFFFLHPSPDATKNVLFCYILPQQQFTVHIMQFLHLFFFRFWTILIINK